MSRLVSRDTINTMLSHRVGVEPEVQPLTLLYKTICSKYNATAITLNENNEKVFTSYIKQNINNALTEHQLTLLKTNRKLNFYTTFKNDNKKAEFLNMIKNPLHRTALNKFRLGNHRLHIETGRHTHRKK